MKALVASLGGVVVVTALNVLLLLAPRFDALAALDLEVARQEASARRVTGLVCTDVCTAGDRTHDAERLAALEALLPREDVTGALVPVLAKAAEAAGLDGFTATPRAPEPSGVPEVVDVPLQLRAQGTWGAVAVFLDAISSGHPGRRAVSLELENPVPADGAIVADATLVFDVPWSKADGVAPPEPEPAPRRGLELLVDRPEPTTPHAFFPAASGPALPAAATAGYDPTGLRDPFATPGVKLFAGAATPLTGKECERKPLVRPLPAPLPAPPGEDDAPATLDDPRAPHERNTTFTSRLDELRVLRVEGRCALVVDQAGTCHEVIAGDPVGRRGAVASSITPRALAVTVWTTNVRTGAEFARRVDLPVVGKATPLPPGFCSPRR